MTEHQVEATQVQRLDRGDIALNAGDAITDAASAASWRSFSSIGADGIEHGDAVPGQRQRQGVAAVTAADVEDAPGAAAQPLNRCAECMGDDRESAAGSRASRDRRATQPCAGRRPGRRRPPWRSAHPVPQHFQGHLHRGQLDLLAAVSLSNRSTRWIDRLVGAAGGEVDQADRLHSVPPVGPATPVMATLTWALEFSSAPSAIIRATGSETAP